jgi:hypothetical protein
MQKPTCKFVWGKFGFGMKNSIHSLLQGKQKIQNNGYQNHYPVTAHLLSVGLEVTQILLNHRRIGTNGNFCQMLHYLFLNRGELGPKPGKQNETGRNGNNRDIAKISGNGQAIMITMKSLPDYFPDEIELLFTKINPFVPDLHSKSVCKFPIPIKSYWSEGP